tara:strand:- start:1317 stop:6641 length:5325 start_codon:yes stop_codon:yes gene_type:complete
MPAPAPIVVKDEQERLRMIDQFKIDADLDPMNPADMEILKGFESRVITSSATSVTPLVPVIPAQPATKAATPTMDAEPITAGLGELYTPNPPEPDYQVTFKDEQRRDEDEEARVEEYMELYPQLDEKTIRERVKNESAERSRSLVSAGSRDVSYTSTAIPLEYRKNYDPTGSDFVDAFSRQTSIGVDPGKTSDALVTGLPPSDDPVEVANRQAIAALSRWLRTNEPGYNRMTPDEQRSMIASTILGLRFPSSIKEAGVGSGGMAAEDDATVFGRLEDQGSTPDYNPAQMAYLKEQRASLTRSVGANAANELLGDPQWYEDPELKRQRLAADPQFEGLLGLGVYRYPSGAVVESTPMYVVRLIAAPANFMVGGAVGLGQAAISAVAPTISDAWQSGRANSELNPASDRSSLVGGNSPLSIAFDNVKRNRGATEEIYDLGITTGAVDYIPGGRAGLFLVGLGVDVLAVPVLPGAGAVMEIASSGAKAARVATAAGKGKVAIVAAGAVGAVKTAPGALLRSAGRGLADVPLALPRAVYGAGTGIPRTLANVAVGLGDAFGMARVAKVGRVVEDVVGSANSLVAKLGKLTEAPGDLRLIAASDYIGAIKAGRLSNLPGELRAIVESDNALIKAAIAGEANALTDRRMGKWLQTAVGSNPKLVAGKQVTGFRELAEAVLSSPEGAEAIAAIARTDSVIGYVLKADPGTEGKLYLLTNRVAVSSSEKANTILKEAAEHVVTKAIQTLLSKADPKAFEEAKGVVTSYLRNAAETAHSSRPGSAKLVETVANLDAAVPMERALGRSIIEMVTDDIALSGKYVAVSEENMGALTPVALRELVRPLDLRRGLITTWLARYLDPVDDTKGLWTPTVTAVTNKIQQQLAGLPATMAQAANDVMRKNPMLSRGEAVLKMLSDELVGLNPDAATAKAVSMARSIESMVVYNRPTTFMSVLTAPFAKTIPLSKDVGVRALLANAGQKLEAGLAAVPSNGAASVIKVLNDYIVEAQAIATKHKLHLNVVDPSSVNELAVAVLFDIRADRILKSGIDELEGSLRTLIPASIVKDAGFKHAQDIHVIVHDILGAKLKGTWTGPADLVALMKEKIPTGPERAAKRAPSEALAKSTAERAAANRTVDRNIEDFFSDPIAERASKRTADDAAAKRAVNVAAAKRAGDRTIDDFFSDRLILDEAAELADRLKARDLGLLRAIKAAESAADDVLRAQKLDGIVPPENVSRLLRDIQLTFGADKINDGLLVHPQARAFVAGLKESSYDVNKLVDYVRKNPNTGITALLRDTWDGIQKLQYWFMLNTRTRFHGVNIMTAPFIIDSTIGGAKAKGAIENFAPGLLLSRIVEEQQAVRSLPEIANNQATLTSLAVTTPSGKTYTYGDLADLATSAGIRTTASGLSGGKAAINPLTQWLKAEQAVHWLRPTGELSLMVRRVLIDAPAGFASQMDGMWRGAVLIDALKAGSSETEAVQLARAALFDYGRLTAWEQKYISSWFMYYSFTRASLANTLEQLLTNPSRLANQIKVSKGFNVGEERNQGSFARPLFYESGFMPSRAWLGSHTTGEGRQNYGSYAPPLPLVDSYVFLMKIIGTSLRYGSLGALQGSQDFQPAEYMMERVNPVAGAFISDRPQTMYGYGKIDDRHIAWLKATGQWDLFTSQIGQPTLREAKPGETAWVEIDGNPMVYTFEGDKKSISNYVHLVMAVNAAGAGLTIADYAPFVAGIEEPIQMGVALDKPVLSARGIAHGSGLVTTSASEDPADVLERNRKAAWSDMKKRD